MKPGAAIRRNGRIKRAPGGVRRRSMRSFHKGRALSASLAAAGAAVAVLLLMPAGHGTVPCRQYSGGTIDAPGRYCLTRDLDAGVVIEADNVDLDLDGHCIRGPRERDAVSHGVLIVPPHRHIRISDGCIEGFMYGILADDRAEATRGSHIVVENLVIRDSSFRGVTIYGAHSRVSNVTVERIGGTQVFGNAFAFGIEMHDDHCRVTNNIVREFYPAGEGEGVGISLSSKDTHNCVVAGNLIRNGRLPQTGRTFGLWVRNRSKVKNNVIVNVTFAMALAGERTSANTRNNEVVRAQARY